MDSPSAQTAARPPDGRHLSDVTLVARAQDGDPDAFEVLVLRHQDRMVRVALRVLGSREAAGDAVQEAFLAAWKRLESFRGEAPFAGWLYRIVANQAATQAHKVQWTAELDDVVDQTVSLRTSADERPERLVEQRQMVEALVVVLASLPSEQRTCWVLRELEGLSYDEIAAAVGAPEPTVRGRLFRARARVAEGMRSWR